MCPISLVAFGTHTVNPPPPTAVGLLHQGSPKNTKNKEEKSLETQCFQGFCLIYLLKRHIVSRTKKIGGADSKNAVCAADWCG